ncbi:MAG: TVP38/TMEM64 family protein [Ruminococcaceae bacterium]|nr:TVP38/TMEM64 family protein [Oscillospiraceae bacterium]
MITDKKRKILSGTVIIAFLVFCFVVGWFVGKPMLRFVEDYEGFKAWIEQSGFMGRVYFVLMVIFQVIIALVPGEPLEIAAGFAFGAIEGTILCVIGITVGSIIVFYLVRKFGIKLVEVFFSTEKIKSLKFLQNKKKVTALVFLMFFLPGTPKDLLTYFVGLTKINFWAFFFIASIARLPSIVTSTIGGDRLVEGDYFVAIVVFVATFALSVLGWFAYTRILRSKDNQTKQEN